MFYKYELRDHSLYTCISDHI